jgi:hypothetical protein
MRSPILDTHSIVGWIPRIGPTAAAGLRTILRWGSHHTGLPAIVVAAIAIVLSWRIIKRSFRLAVEVVIALMLLVVATRLGWLAW